MYSALKEYRENTTLAEQKEFAKKLQVWLEPYTQEVYVKVMKQMIDIINNPCTLKLIDELYKRTIDERNDEVSTISFSIGYDEDFVKYHLHNHPLTHSSSYRNVLYDMYIADENSYTKVSA